MAEKKAPLRVLHVVSAMERGGAEMLIMNVYRNIDRTKVQFDFITHGGRTGSFEQEILSMGGEIYNIPSLGSSGPIGYLKNVMAVMSKKNYQAVHIHTDYQSGIPALAAKRCGITTRICHSHSSSWIKKNGIFGKIILYILRALILLYATTLCSCSREAAAFLFGKRAVQKNRVNIIKNAIDIMDYLPSDTNHRKAVLEELKLDEHVKTIGHVGRFSKSKNQMFLLHILKKLVEKDPRYVAILIGDGPLKEEVQEEARKLGLLPHIKFLGVRSDIPRLMKAFDVFVFPSRFEGFGIVMLEAQSAGVPCIASTAVPRATDMKLGIVRYVNLEEGPLIWSRHIRSAILLKRPRKREIVQNITEQGFNIRTNIQEWIHLYGAQTS